MLKILKDNKNFDFLPSDARTLLHTPRAIQIKKMGNGEYCYNGVESSLRVALKEVNKPSKLSLKINIDGMSPYKNSTKELWPILFSVKEMKCIDPLYAAIYFGDGKPPLIPFLTPFVEELKSLINKGFKINGNLIEITIDCFICDTPARAFIKGTAYSNSEYGACIKCTVVGEYDKTGRHMSYPDINCTLRTDADFRIKRDKNHHKEDTPLTHLPIDMIQDFVVADELHLFHLGKVSTTQLPISFCNLHLHMFVIYILFNHFSNRYYTETANRMDKWQF